MSFRTETLKEGRHKKCTIAINMYKLITILVLDFILVYIQILRMRGYCFTWDEGISYTRFVRPYFEPNQSIFIGVKNYIYGVFIVGSPHIVNIANNHILNSALMGICSSITNTTYNEFVLRIPSMLLFLVFIAVVSVELIKENMNMITAGMLLFASVVSEFFALARGYSQAACFVLLGIVFFEKWEGNHNKYYYGNKFGCLYLSMIMLSIAEVAHTISLIPVACIYLYIIYLLYTRMMLIQFIRRGCFIVILPLVVVINLSMVRYHFWVSTNDCSLFCSENFSIFAIISEYCMNISYRHYYLVTIIVIVAMCYYLMLMLVKKRENGFKSVDNPIMENCYIIIFVMNLLLMIALGIIFKKGVPSQRELIPSYPLFCYAVGQLVDRIMKTCLHKIKCIVSICICLVMATSFFRS